MKGQVTRMDLLDMYLALTMGFSFKTKHGTYKYEDIKNGKPATLDDFINFVSKIKKSEMEQLKKKTLEGENL